MGDVVEGKALAGGRRGAELQTKPQVHEHGAQLPLLPSQNFWTGLPVAREH